MERDQVWQHLQQYIESKRREPGTTKSDRLLSSLECITPSDISFGEPPTYTFARLHCNSTAVGTSSFKGSETQRTIARDYVTDECVFVDGHFGAGLQGLSRFYLKENERMDNIFPFDEMENVAKRYGFQLHNQYFRDLNIILNSHRLNRYSVQTTKGSFVYPIRPIFATIKRNKDILIGYVWEKNGKKFVLIQPEDENKNNKSGCAPWMFLGFIFPPIFVVAFFVMLFKD